MLNDNKLIGCDERVKSLAYWLDNKAKLLGYELFISSGSRSPEQNRLAGGAPNSLHLRGLAIDFFYTDKDIIFSHVSEIWELVKAQDGVFKGCNVMEVCRGLINGKWINHIHLGFNPDYAEPVAFTGVYQPIDGTV